MRITKAIFSSCLLAATALAQSPRGFTPRTRHHLGVQYGDIELHLGEELPQSVPDASTPTVFSYRHLPGTYMILLTDLSIPFMFFPDNETSTLAPGLGKNRTTRLHWWQTDVTHDAWTSGFCYPNASALAPYAGPQPPSGDGFHQYVFWLFRQPDRFQAPPASLVSDWQDPGSDARFNFSVPALVAQVGEPISANFMRVENAGNPGAPTAPSGR
ncbi:hypothetical protein ANO11243_044430 [Dothideomycetidae sp. 11243]|nr:hypothetical protein ANO11243_044430 [fungal sp. No.11243]